MSLSADYRNNNKKIIKVCCCKKSTWWQVPMLTVFTFFFFCQSGRGSTGKEEMPLHSSHYRFPGVSYSLEMDAFGVF